MNGNEHLIDLYFAVKNGVNEESASVAATFAFVDDVCNVDLLVSIGDKDLTIKFPLYGGLRTLASFVLRGQ